MCSNDPCQAEILRKVLDLVVVTERQFEPWICDTICDNIHSLLKSCATEESFAEKISSPLHDVVHKDHCNVKLKLQVTRLALLYFGHDFINASEVLVHIDAFPAEVFEIFSMLLPPLCESNCGVKDATPVDSVSPTSISMESSAGVIASKQDQGRTLIAAQIIDIVIMNVKESLQSASVSLRKAAVNFMTKYCSFQFKTDPDAVQMKLKNGFDDSFLCDVLRAIFDIDSDGRNVAVELVNKCLGRLISPENEGFKHLSKIRAHMVSQSLDANDLLLSSHDAQVIEAANFNYCCTELYNQIFFRELFESLLASGKLKVMQEVLAKLCDAKNLVILSVVSNSFLSEKNYSKAAHFFWEGTFRNQFVSNTLMQDTMDIIYDDCANLKEQRSALSILNDIINKGELINIINNSNVCHHYSKCDETSFKCFMSTYLTFLMECSADSFSMLSESSPKLFNLPDFATSCDVLLPDLTKLLIRKLLSGDSRIRDLVLEFVGKLEQSLVDLSVVKHILTASYGDEDFYIKSSCFKVLSGFDSKKLPDGLTHTLNQIIKYIEHEDSMVTISFFFFLQKHYHLIQDLIHNNLDTISNESKCLKNGSDFKNGDYQNISLDVDAVINEVCDSADCSDVSLIAAYQEKDTENSSLPPEKQLVSGIFRLLASDRCDVERMKASVELMITILRNLSETEQCFVIDFMKHGFFDLVESLNSPFLKQTIRDFNSILNGARIFSELETPKNQNLKTVLSLLESTPDPNIVMDCY